MSFSVTGEEQSDRLRKTTLGGVAGSSAGGLAGLFGNDPQLLIVGMFGSAVGAFSGWIAYLVLSAIASTERGRLLLEYHVGGLKGVREQLKLDNKQLLLRALSEWSQSFGRLVKKQTADMLSITNPAVGHDSRRLVIRGWLTSITDVFNLVFEVLAKEPQYRLRVTILVYGLNNSNVVGRHWISYAGSLPEHRTKDFDETSMAYKVLLEEIVSPHFTAIDKANKEGQNRGERSYHSFFAFRITDYAVLCVDWPGDLDENDAYVQVARKLYELDVIPAIKDLLSSRSQAVQNELGLKPLPVPLPR